MANSRFSISNNSALGLCVLFSLLSLVSDSWVVIWLAIEVSSFFFLPVFLLGEGVENKKVSVISLWKFVLVQIICSLLLYFLLICEDLWGWVFPLNSEGVILVTLFNIGCYPFHGWIFYVLESLSWESFVIFATVLNVPPLFLISNVANSESCLFLLLWSGVAMSFWVVNNHTLKWSFLILSSYSINWTSLSLVFSESVGVVFVVLYFSLFFGIGNSLQSSNNSHFSFLEISSSSNTVKIGFAIQLLFLLGTPPGGVFLGKILVLGNLVHLGSFLVAFLLLLSSFVVSFFLLNGVTLSLLSGVTLWNENDWIKSSWGLILSSSFLSFFFLL